MLNFCMGINIILHRRWHPALTGFGGFLPLATNPRVMIVFKKRLFSLAGDQWDAM